MSSFRLRVKRQTHSLMAFMLHGLVIYSSIDKRLSVVVTSFLDFVYQREWNIHNGHLHYQVILQK